MNKKSPNLIVSISYIHRHKMWHFSGVSRPFTPVEVVRATIMRASPDVSQIRTTMTQAPRNGAALARATLARRSGDPEPCGTRHARQAATIMALARHACL